VRAGACVAYSVPPARDPGDLSDAEAIEQAAAFFAAIAPNFAAEGASLAFEANPAAYGCRFVTRTAEAIALVARVAAPGFGLQIDTGTMMVNAEDPMLLAEAVPLAVHCHASAPQLGPVAPHAAAHANLAAGLRKAGITAISRFRPLAVSAIVLARLAGVTPALCVDWSLPGCAACHGYVRRRDPVRTEGRGSLPITFWDATVSRCSRSHHHANSRRRLITMFLEATITCLPGSASFCSAQKVTRRWVDSSELSFRTLAHLRA
jgi:hypothetical protein